MTLAATGLSFGYPGRVLGEGIDLTLRGGDALALLGPNGGGKTTLMKTLMGLLPPLAGTVAVGGRALASFSVQERARIIGYVPQSSGSAFAFTARDAVLMGRTAHGGVFAQPSRRDREAAEEMLARMGVAHLADRPITMISGGERQLVLIARALAQEPRFIVLDEPTASLDFGNQGKVMREARRLADAGIGVIFTTHDPNQAERYATSVAMLRAGRLSPPASPGSALDGRSLAALYDTPVGVLTDAGGARRAFLPE